MFCENIRYLRRAAGYSQQDLADQFGYKSFTTIQKWEDGTSKPSFAILERLAQLYHVTVSDLMNRDLCKQDTRIPVLGTVRGGQPLWAEQQFSGYETVTETLRQPEEYFCLDVVGDSMKDARILPGDRLFVHKQSTLDNNEIGVVLIGNEATVKRVVFHEDCMILYPANDAYQPIVLTQTDQNEQGVRILGKVVYNKISY